MASKNTRRNNRKTSVNQTEPKERVKITPWMIISGIILAVIVVVFAGGPLLGGIAAPSRLIFGTFGGKDIEYTQGSYFARQREILADQVSSSNSDANVEWQNYQVWKGAYDRTVLHTAILQDAERSGVHVTSRRIDDAIVAFGPWSIDGVLQEDAYRNAPNADKQTYRALFEEEIIHQTYVSDIVNTGIFSSGEAEFVKDIAAKERKIRYSYLDLASYPDEEVASFGAENALLFRSISLSRITIKSNENDAQAVLQKIEDGSSTFEDLAKNQSKDSFADKGGEMGTRLYYNLEAEFNTTEDLDLVFNLGKGETSGVLETDFGWVIYRVDEVASDADFASEESLSEVRTYIERFERGRIEDYMVNKATEVQAAAAEAGLISASLSAGLQTFTTDYFPINYGNSFFLKQIRSIEGDTALSAGAFSDEFLQTVFSLDVDEVSSPLIVGNYVVLVELLEARDAPEEEVSFLADYYPALVQQFQQEELQSSITSSDTYVDNFNETYLRLYSSDG